MTNTESQTLASIVTGNHKAAAVLEKYDLDFCCRGKRSLADACAEKGLSAGMILTELESMYSGNQCKELVFEKMNAQQLISHILLHHHFYVKQAIPQILLHLEKVAAKHSERFPYMPKVLNIFIKVQDEMLSHMYKEEKILFPRILDDHQQKLAGAEACNIPGYISNPVAVMESEHDMVGQLMYDIRSLTNNYTIPENACTTFTTVLNELKDFENDLHTHVHLENNILFPLAMEKAV